MGMKTHITSVIICLIISLAGCSFNVSDINLHDVDIRKVKATVSSAYFLDRNGILYSTGADSDASSYVIYKDKNKGIVAENVVDFGEMVGGGYYIDEQNNLYLWNKNDQPLYNYQKGKISFVLSDVLYVDFSNKNMIYIDTNNNLYLVGEFDEKSYEITKPKLVANNVESADIYNNNLLWCSRDGELGSFGTVSFPEFDILKQRFASEKIEKIQITNNYILLLSNNNLWFFGVEFSTSNNCEDSHFHTLKLLSTEIIEANGSNNAIIALNQDGEAILWGKCISNSTENITSAEYEYLDNYILADNATSVYISGGCICYVDDQFDSKIYHNSGWSEFYGNSTEDEIVGINREPVTWMPRGQGEGSVVPGADRPAG